MSSQFPDYKLHLVPFENDHESILSEFEQLGEKFEYLELSDLYGKTLMMVKEGDSEVNGLTRSDLRKNHPAIRIEDTTQFYDMAVFNRCIETGNVLLMFSPRYYKQIETSSEVSICCSADT